MPRKRVHIAIGVKDQEKLNSSVNYYASLFDQSPDEWGQITLGTGREVTGAYWTTDICYLYVFIGSEFGEEGGVDHLGIQFFNDEEMEATKWRVGSEQHCDEGRWSADPNGITWELFPNIFNDATGD